MELFKKLIGDLEYVAIVLYLAFLTVSQLARLTRNEYRRWQSPRSQGRRKPKRRTPR